MSLICHGAKCRFEGKKYPREQLIQPGKANTRYCEKCYKDEKEEKPKMEYVINELFGKYENANHKYARINPMYRRQLDKLQVDYGYTYKEMRYCLYYFTTIKGNKVDTNKGIGIIPWIYDEAMAHAMNKVRQKLESQVVNTGVIKITMPPPKRRFDLKQKKMINMEELLDGRN